MRLVVAVSALLIAAGPAQGFTSVDGGHAPHDAITAVAAEAGWPEGAVKALQAAVRQPDIDDLREAPVEGDKDRMDASVTFRPWHHCDRVAPATDADAVNATIAYIAHERGLALNLSLPDPVAAVRALGRALHALQDCFSHTDVVDHPPAERRALIDALVRGGPAPALRVCGSQPGAPEIGRPAGDPYPHDDFNKDDAESTPEAEALMADGRSKFEHARELATEATRAFLDDFMGRLDGNESARLLDVELHDGGHDGARGLPAPGLAAPAVALAAVAALLRRTGRRGG